MDLTPEQAALTPCAIILDQLGRRALFMLGAKDLMAIEDRKGLRFKVGRNAKGVNRVDIVLADDDTYTITFSSVRKQRGSYVHDVKVLAQETMVYADSMHRTIETHTGMYTSL